MNRPDLGKFCCSRNWTETNYINRHLENAFSGPTQTHRYTLNSCTPLSWEKQYPPIHFADLLFDYRLTSVWITVSSQRAKAYTTDTVIQLCASSVHKLPRYNRISFLLDFILSRVRWTLLYKLKCILINQNESNGVYINESPFGLTGSLEDITLRSLIAIYITEAYQHAGCSQGARGRPMHLQGPSWACSLFIQRLRWAETPGALRSRRVWVYILYQGLIYCINTSTHSLVYTRCVAHHHTRSPIHSSQNLPDFLCSSLSSDFRPGALDLPVAFWVMDWFKTFFHFSIFFLITPPASRNSTLESIWHASPNPTLDPLLMDPLLSIAVGIFFHTGLHPSLT